MKCCSRARSFCSSAPARWEGILCPQLQAVLGCNGDTYGFFPPPSIFLVMGYCEQDLASLLENMQAPFSEAQVC